MVEARGLADSADDDEAGSKPSAMKTMHYASEGATIISTLRKYTGPMKQHAKNKKDFELHGWVSSLLQIRSSLS